MALSKITNASVTDSTLTTTKLATPNLGRRNLIINGGFDVWQRGTSFSNVNNIYTADRMYVVAGGGTTGDNVTQQTFTVGQTDVPGEPTYFFRFTAGSTSSNKVVHHRIEDVRTGAGQTVTLSFWGKASTAHNSTIELGQNFGSGGSSGVSVAAQSYSLTTSWQKFTFNVALPSISGKTIGTSHYVSIAFIRSLPASNVDIDIAQMQLEVNSQATPFEHRSFGEELALCQRYYERIHYSSTVDYDPYGTSGRVLGAGVWYSASTVLADFQFRTTKRATAAVSVPDSSSILAFVGTAGRSSTDATPFDLMTQNNARINASSWSVNGTLGDGAMVQLEDNKYVEIDAEL